MRVSMPCYGLVLMGGGARAAYEAGVVKGIREILLAAGEDRFFQVYNGTSAGALNAAMLASMASPGRLDLGIDNLYRLWQGLSPGDIFRTEWREAFRSGAHWLTALTTSILPRQLKVAFPSAFLDSAPLARLLTREVHLFNLAEAVDRYGIALAITAFCYSSNQRHVFYQRKAPLQRFGSEIMLQTDINVSHLMASSAIPLVFPAVACNYGGQIDYYGDGVITQRSPLSSSIYLGANHLVVVSTEETGLPPPQLGAPSMSQIAGQLLAQMFNDSLRNDILTTHRINALVDGVTVQSERIRRFRKIEVLHIRPSRSINALAMEVLPKLPRSVRLFLSAMDVKKNNSINLASYLLFIPAFTHALLKLGYDDALQRQQEVRAFFAL